MMFGLMGKCISYIRERRAPKKPVTLALLGVDNSGKTTASFSFAGEPIDKEVPPTVGFRNVNFIFKTYKVTLYDLGGGKNIRPIWKTYFPEVYGVIYLVDSSTPERINEVRDVFRESLEHPNISGKPVLLLANKQDKPNALDEVDICEQLGVESAVNANKCPCRMEAISAWGGTGKKMDPCMRAGLKWLLATVELHWDELKERVEKDMKDAEEQRKIEAAAKRERVRKQKEERERQEEEERKRLGIVKKDSDDEEPIIGDPFKPLDLNELTKKEETLKAEKKHRKELEAQLNQKEAQNTRTLPTHQSQNIDIPAINVSADSLARDETGRLFSPRIRGSALPPLEPLGTPFLDGVQEKKKRKKKMRSHLQQHSQQPQKENVNEVDKDDNDDIIIPTPGRDSSQQSQEDLAEHSLRTASNIKVSTHDDFPSRQLLAAGISRIPSSLDGGDSETADLPRKRKSKKKKFRSHISKDGDESNQKIPPEGELPLQSLEKDGDINSSLQQVQSLKSKREHLPPYEEVKIKMPTHSALDSSRSQNGLPRGTKLSRNSQMHSNTSFGSDYAGSRTWGLAEELPAVDNDTVVFKQPNFISDVD
ncbi:hypothetical protein C0Q70_10720 [Pomacea canaliculata]|uniref:ADP-ribosylation factor-like protein 13B n=2 Tax=Pomacea canaliculata TaxID=400727 RepID=A0A2T7P3Y3_POMCA|nr:hypothetical protein C0Q70_10720 [Pomacea canaliculata]